jgi:hypothetical protein
LLKGGIFLDGRLGAGVQEDRAGVIVFDDGQLWKVCRKGDAGDKPGLAEGCVLTY